MNKVFDGQTKKNDSNNTKHMEPPRRSLNIPLAEGALSSTEKEVKRKNELVTKSHKNKSHSTWYQHLHE